MTISHRVGLLLFPKITQLDLAGPYEVFCRMPDAAVHLLWKDTQPIRSEWGLELRPDTTFEDCPALDVFCVPGGGGVFEARIMQPGLYPFVSHSFASVDMGEVGSLDGESPPDRRPSSTSMRPRFRADRSRGRTGRGRRGSGG